MKKLLILVTISILVGVPAAFACGGEMKPYQGGVSNFSSSNAPPPPLASKRSVSDASSLAKCLKKKKVILYGSDSCPHCISQKKLFGDAFKYITYIECGKNPKACEKAEIAAYPTWIYKSQKVTGTQTLKALSELSQCSY